MKKLYTFLPFAQQPECTLLAPLPIAELPPRNLLLWYRNAGFGATVLNRLLGTNSDHSINLPVHFQ
jgi:hypothetical protein